MRGPPRTGARPGDVYGRYTLVEFAEMTRNGQHWRVRCACGSESTKALSHLRWRTRVGAMPECAHCQQHRGTKRLSAFGKVLSIEAWAAEIGLRPRALQDRLSRLPSEAALTLSVNARYGDTQGLGEPRSWSWDVLRWEDDPWAQRFVEEHPGGATLEEVGDVIGVTRERVRQIEVKALRKLRRIGAFHTYQFGEWWE